MKQQLPLQITVSKPCEQEWDMLIPSAEGRFCESCAQDVIDFTSMSDAELMDYLVHQMKPGVCGKFRNEQLYAPAHPATSLSSFPSWMRYAAFSLFALFSKNSYAQKQEAVTKSYPNSARYETIKTSGDSVSYLFKGRIMDAESGKGLAYAAISIYGPGSVRPVSGRADSSGYYRMEVASSSMNDHFRIEISSFRYKLAVPGCQPQAGGLDFRIKESPVPRRGGLFRKKKALYHTMGCPSF